MSAKNDLPPELASFETQLRQQTLPTSRVNRDELMYQAGWAAAEASRKSTKLWPATASVLAASVLVLGAMLARSSPDLPTVADAQLVSSPADEATPAAKAQTPVPSEPHRPRSRRTLNSPFLAMRDRALRMEFNEPVSYAGTGEVQIPEIVTARELMQEMLGEKS